CPGADAAPVTVASTAATRVAAVTVARPGNGCYQWPREHPARFLLLLVLLSEPTGGGRGTRVLKFNRTHPESRQRPWRLFCRQSPAGNARQRPRSTRMAPHTDDLRIRRIDALVPPAQLIAELPCSGEASETVAASRHALHRILHGQDDRLAVVIGPCSIHDPAAAMEYARRLRPLRDSLGDA